MPWKPRPSKILQSPTMKPSLWAHHVHIADSSVVCLLMPPFSSCTLYSFVALFTPGFPRGAPDLPATTKIQNHCSPPLIRSSFSHLWNHLPQSPQYHSSLHSFKTAIHHISDPPQSKTIIFSTLVLRCPLKQWFSTWGSRDCFLGSREGCQNK